MTTNASARHATPPSRNASGVDPPATAATPVTLSSIAMPGAITDTEIAIASQRRSDPCASSPVAAPGIRSGLVLAIVAVLSMSFGHEDGAVVQDVVEGQGGAISFNDPVIELNVDRVSAVRVHGLDVGKFGVEKVAVAAVARSGDIGAQAALGHQADLLRPRADHLPHLRDLVLAQLTREAEQHDVLQCHCRSFIAAPLRPSVELEVLAHFPVADILRIHQRAIRDRSLVPAVFRLL